MRDQNKKCVFILPYFGRFNNYFEIFLKSCGYNTSFDWIIFTDCAANYSYPDNVHVYSITFHEMQERIRAKLGFNNCLEEPYKLCDYKPAYGFLFEEYISGYEYWGHCDCDLIFGNLNKLLLPLLNQGYDKLFAAGHLTIYRNNYENNRVFMSAYKGTELYKEAFSTNSIFVFDEDCKYDHNVHSIFLDQKKKIYTKDISMNVAASRARITRTFYDSDRRDWQLEQYVPARYYWHEGNVIRLRQEKKTKKVETDEYIYIHLQMRKMKVPSDIVSANIIQIYPDKFSSEKILPDSYAEMRWLSLKLPNTFWINIYKNKLIKKLHIKKQ